MKSNVIHDTRRFTVTSYGNGTAYVLAHKALEQSILFQGDDADAFITELDALTSRRPVVSYDEALGAMWNDYHVVAG